MKEISVQCEVLESRCGAVGLGPQQCHCASLFTSVQHFQLLGFVPL